MPPDISYTPAENADQTPQTGPNPSATALASLGTDLITASPPDLHPGWELYPEYPTLRFIRESFDTRSRGRETITASRPQTMVGIQIAAQVAGVNPPIFNLHNIDPRLRTIFHGHTNHLATPIPQPITMPHQLGIVPQHAPPHLMGPVPQPIGILNQGSIAQSAVPPPMGTSTQNATTIHHTGFQAILPDRVLAVLNTQAYDSYWLINRGINLDSFSLTSALKLDKLFRVGALRTGDSFVVVVDTLNNRVVNTSRKEITVRSVSQRGLPTMNIPFSNPTTAPFILADVTGTREMVNQLISNDPTILDAHKTRYSAWDSIDIYRQGARIDTLTNVRKAYHVYQDAIDDWRLRNNQPRRRRIGPKNSDVKCNKGYFTKQMADGSRVPIKDQLQAQSGKAGKDKRARFNEDI